MELYKRSANILFIEEKKDQKKYIGKPSIFSLKEKHEKILYRRIKKISSPFRKLVLKGEFESALKMLDIIEIPLANFFDNVIVNEQDNNLRENRLLILSMIRSVFEDIGDLSKIELN
ncbi:MAG: DALR anticodon-binding domain-containing protein [Verrucomicrobiota bacterium]